MNGSAAAATAADLGIQGQVDADLQGLAAVHREVRAAILSGDLPAGQTVSQVQLARQLGVSRTPLREALRMLEREGLVIAEQNKRVRIASFDIDDLEQVYAMRITLEPLAARLSVPALTDEDVDDMRGDYARMAFYTERRDYEGWEEPHRSFHQRILQYSGVRFVRTLGELYDHALRYRRLTTTQAPAAWTSGDIEHGALLEAAAERDVPAVANLLARHYARVALNAVALSMPERDPRVIREALRSVVEGGSRP